MANDPAGPDSADSLQRAPPRPSAGERAPSKNLSSALRHNHPNEGSKAFPEYRASLERELPDIRHQTQEWEEEYAVHDTDITAYVESVEDSEKDTIVSFLAHHSWRWDHQVTLHRP